MKYLLITLAIIALIIIIVLLVFLSKTIRKAKTIGSKTNVISSKIENSKNKIEYIESVKNKTLLDELFLTYLIIGDTIKDLRRKKKSTVKSITRAYIKDTKNKSYKELPNKIKQFI